MSLLNVTCSQSTFPLLLSSAQAVITFLTHSHNKPPMALHFVQKKRIAQLHAHFFNDPSSTDCITLVFNDPHFLGEVYVCPEVAAEYISDTQGDLEEEITLYVVHGFLHLIGYTDTQVKEAQKMRWEERRHMAILAKNHLRVRIKP